MATVMPSPAWGRAMLGEPLTLVEMLWLPLLEAGSAPASFCFSIGFGCRVQTGDAGEAISAVLRAGPAELRMEPAAPDGR